LHSFFYIFLSCFNFIYFHFVYFHFFLFSLFSIFMCFFFLLVLKFFSTIKVFLTFNFCFSRCKFEV
jgi:hypothetical protein